MINKINLFVSDALRDSVPTVQLKNREKHPCYLKSLIKITYYSDYKMTASFYKYNRNFIVRTDQGIIQRSWAGSEICLKGDLHMKTS